MFSVPLLLAFLPLAVSASSPISKCPKKFIIPVQYHNTPHFVYTKGPGLYGLSQYLINDFALTNNQLVSLNNGGGSASVGKDAGAGGDYIISSALNPDLFKPLNASFDANCNILLSKRLSDTVAIDTVYVVNASFADPAALYLLPRSAPPPDDSILVTLTPVVSPL